MTLPATQPLTLEALARLGASEVDAFVRQHGKAALVLEASEPAPAGSASRVDTPDPREDTTSLVAVVSPLGHGRSLTRDSLVYFVEKTDRNPFGHMITIGRAPNNDVIIADSRISKLHAYVVERAPDFAIIDAGSTNGSKVNGSPIRAGEAAVLHDHASIELAPGVVLRFLWPRSLFLAARPFAT